MIKRIPTTTSHMALSLVQKRSFKHIAVSSRLVSLQYMPAPSCGVAGERRFAVPSVVYLICAIALLLLLIFLAAVTAARHRLTGLRRRAESAYGALEKELKRRSDLLPRLFELARPVFASQPALYDEILAARYGSGRAETLIGKNEQELLLEKKTIALFAAGGNVPDLIASPEFAAVQSSFLSAGHDIAAAAEAYNFAVAEYNRIFDRPLSRLVRHLSPMRKYSLYYAEERQDA